MLIAMNYISLKGKLGRSDLSTVTLMINGARRNKIADILTIKSPKTYRVFARLGGCSLEVETTQYTEYRSVLFLKSMRKGEGGK